MVAPMNFTPYGPADATPPLARGDQDALTALGILFILYGAVLGAVAGLFSIIAVLPALLHSAVERSPGAPNDLPPWFLTGMFLLLFGMASLVFVVQAVLMVWGGVGMLRKRWYAVALVAACLVVTNFPLGTALGVAALVFLNKAPIKRAFAQS